MTYGLSKMNNAQKLHKERWGIRVSVQLMLASTAITLALVFYTVGVFGERRVGSLRVRHVVLFWFGLACDSTGTAIMTAMARADSGAAMPLVHAVTGAAAIALMLFHAVWALVTLLRRDGRALEAFHRLSTVVWLAWLVPYLIGLLMGMPMLSLSSLPATVASLVVVAALARALARGEQDEERKRAL